jgi:hypothetical protein
MKWFEEASNNSYFYCFAIAKHLFKSLALGKSEFLEIPLND